MSTTETITGYEQITPPTDGDVVQIVDGAVHAPPHPIIPFIEGDGIGPDIWKATQRVLDAAVDKAYKGKRKFVWFEVFAGEKANEKYGEWLPEDTLKALTEFRVGIKGPLTTPVGGGIRSLNVAIRQQLDLYACVRPVRWFEGVPSPVKQPRKLRIVIFRENTEDVYSGIEWPEGSAEARDVIDFLNQRVEKSIPPDSGIGVKPISIARSKRLVRMGIKYALANHYCNVALVHKGNIMKFTEGAFRDWGYAVARDEFGDLTITEQEVYEKHKGWPPGDRIVIKDRIADAMFQQILLRPDEYDVICTTNLNGDYLSDAAAAQVGGLGLAPGANIGDAVACFEATHGTAPKYAGQDKVNPGSLILSGEMMLRHLGWREAANLVIRGIEGALAQKLVTYDLERQMEGATLLKCSEFGEAIIDHMT